MEKVFSLVRIPFVSDSLVNRCHLFSAFNQQWQQPPPPPSASHSRKWISVYHSRQLATAQCHSHHAHNREHKQYHCMRKAATFIHLFSWTWESERERRTPSVWCYLFISCDRQQNCRFIFKHTLFDGAIDRWSQFTCSNSLSSLKWRLV